MIHDKRQMYQLQMAGCLGNSLPQYMSLREWMSHRYEWPLWAVRFLDTLNDSRTKFNLDPVQLQIYCYDFLGLGYTTPINISPMLDHLDPRFWGQLWDGPAGWALWYINEPLQHGLTWRTAFNTVGLAKNVDGPRARVTVREYANENSYNDLLDLFDRYPDHVIEFSCFGQCLGTIPGRNTVVWEVRGY